MKLNRFLMHWEMLSPLLYATLIFSVLRPKTSLEKFLHWCVKTYIGERNFDRLKEKLVPAFVSDELAPEDFVLNIVGLVENAISTR